MNIDPNNPVVITCAQGIGEEMKGNVSAAAALYARAWEMKENDFEACIVAHYVARVQTTPGDILHWNLEAVKYAELVGESVQAFYPSLFLNIGKAYEDLENIHEAEKYYLMAMGKISLLPDDELGRLTRDAIQRELQRTTNHQF